jgi:CubicO group peptidase (beta-lactamase class C family)
MPTQTTLVTEAVAALRERAQAEVEAGFVPSCQFAIARDGEVLVQETVGNAPPGARYSIFSCTKPLVASVVWQLIGEGKLDPALPVATWWPGFAQHGKDKVTLEQVMLHTGGFPGATLTREAFSDRAVRVAEMEAWELAWEPGTRFEYHPLSAHWVLAELIALRTGLDHRAALRERVLDPLGLDRLELGVPPERQSDIQPLTFSGELPTREEIRAVLGFDLDLPITPDGVEATSVFNDPQVRAAGAPGGGGVSDAASLARFYQELLHNNRGLWDSEVLNDVKTNIRNRFPVFLSGSAERSLGLEIASAAEGARYRIGLGATSPRTFGHGGAHGQIAWADPDSGLSFVFLSNGADRNFLREARRSRELCELAVRCAA